MAKTVLPHFHRNKYSRWYCAIVNRARARALEGYRERHHVIPRSLGGSNDKSNLVDLTFREHFICHWLLTKMTKGEARRTALRALHYMCHGNGNGKKNGKKRRIIAGWQYEVARRAVRDAQIGTKRPGLHDKKFKKRLSARMKGNNHNKGKKRVVTEEWKANVRAGFTTKVRAKISKRMKGNRYGEKTRGRPNPKVSLALKGRKHTFERVERQKAGYTAKVRARMSAKRKGVPRTFTPEHLANLRAALIERNRKFIRRGWKHTPEARAKMSAAKKGKKLPQDTYAKIYTPEHRAKLSARMAEYNRSGRTSPWQNLLGHLAHFRSKDLPA